MRQISSWASLAPANQVGSMFGISASSVRSYDQAVLGRDTPPPNLDGIRALLVDEKSVRKQHNYVTVVLNADTGELLHMQEGKKGESLAVFLRSLSEDQKRSIQAVGMDRGGAYKRAVEQNLPNTAIVFDRFHLVMNVNQAVDETRRIEWNKASKEDKKFIKGGRFLLLTNASNLAEKKQPKLQELMAANQSLSTAYLLKEQFQSVYHYKSEGWAKRYLLQWCALAQESELKPFVRLAKGFLKSTKEIVSYAKHKITSGKIESFNNQIARIIHRSCGVSNLDYLFIRLRHATVMRSAWRAIIAALAESGNKLGDEQWRGREVIRDLDQLIYRNIEKIASSRLTRHPDHKIDYGTVFEPLDSINKRNFWWAVSGLLNQKGKGPKTLPFWFWQFQR